MTDAEKKNLAGLWAMYAAYYRTKIDDQVLRMYADDLSDLDFASVRDALDSYRKNPKNRTLPIPAVIRDQLSPNVDPDSTAREIAARIGGAITRFGWANGEQARNFIGEIGWNVIQRRGGWSHLCQNHGVTIDPTAFEAQVREQVKSDVKYGASTIANMIGIGPGIKQGELQSISEIMKALPVPQSETEGA